MQRLRHDRRVGRFFRPMIDPSCGRCGLLQDIAGLGAITLFVVAVVWIAATAGDLVALWRLGGGP